jgi:hypothetical protein
MKAISSGIRWQIVEGADLIMVWLDESGFHSHRVSKFNTPDAIGHDMTTIRFEDLVLAAEGQLPLL